MTTEFETNFSEATKLASETIIRWSQSKDQSRKVQGQTALKTWKQITGKKQQQLNETEKSFIIRWYLRALEG